MKGKPKTPKKRRPAASKNTPSLAAAVKLAGIPPADDSDRNEKKRFSEKLSAQLAQEIAEGLRSIGFKTTKPLRDGPGEKEFQGGLGPKKVDVSYADERHGLLMAVTIKSINFPPFGKNLKNRFGDLLTEAITLHLRFPYSVVCMLFAFPVRSREDITKGRKMSTYERARKLFATVSGRKDYTDPGEKFEDVTIMLFTPYSDLPEDSIIVELFDAQSGRACTESEYFEKLRKIYNLRNPHALIGEEELGEGESESE